MPRSESGRFPGPPQRVQRGTYFALQARMESFVRALRFAVRSLARAPGFTAAATVALALGVGGSSAIFSVVDGIVLRPLAVPEPDRLLTVYETSPQKANHTFSTADYL